MGSPLDSTGAVKSPSRYAALNMHGEQMTGMVTQRSPYRDGAVAYRDSKYYGLGRIDTISDGINREITQKLTDQRRPGSTVYNSNNFPAALSFYSWKYIQSKQEVVRVIEDGVDGVIYDATAGQKSTLFNKSAGAGPARFLGVNTELFIADGVDTKKVLRSAKVWTAATVYKSGDFIVDSNGNLQVAFGAIAKGIINSQIQDSPHAGGFPPITSTVTLTLTAGTVPFATGTEVTFLGATNAAVLNGQTYPIFDLGGTLMNVIVPLTTAYASTPDTGTAYTNGDGSQTGTSGAVAPAWAAGLGAPTYEGVGFANLVWINKGPATQNWGMVAPTVAPSVIQLPTSSRLQRWAASTFYWTQQVAIDPTGALLINLLTGGTTAGAPPVFSTIVGHATTDGTAVWVTMYNAGTPGNTWIASGSPSAGSYTTYPVAGTNYVFRATQAGVSQAAVPQFVATLGALVNDGTAIWQNVGPLLPYAGVGSSQKVSTAAAILDSNGYAQNIQLSGISGVTEPVWNESSVGNLTTDGSATWINAGAVSVLAGGLTQYAYSWGSSVTKNFTNASPLSTPVLRQADKDVLVQGPGPTDPQDDIVRVWRYAQGKSILVFVGDVPILGLGMVWSFLDTIPDDTDLVAQIAAPIAEENDPPPSNITAMAYHLQRLWGIVDNTVVYSGGPDTLVGAGNETFPPSNRIPYPAQPIFIQPVTVQGGGILVFTTCGVYIILGIGTANDPFYTTIYYASLNLAGYTAIDVYNTAIFLMEANGKVSMLAIEYPFNPQTGYTEVGFPIGDQFQQVTTGGTNANLYNPATAYVSWHIGGSGDTNMFVSDGAVGWFSLNMLNPPEEGVLWNPRAAIVGGTSAVQSVEVMSGIYRLLIGPPSGGTGPILMRDSTGAVFSDNGTAYPAWDDKGVILMCSTGQWAEVAHISTKSTAVGKRPAISTLMGEIQATVSHPWKRLNLNDKSNDPPETPKSESVFSDRYVLADNGAPYTGDCISIRFDYGTQAFGDELLDWGIFATLMNEREEQVAPS